MYDAEQKKYTCPCGNPVPYKKTVTKKNSPGGGIRRPMRDTSATTKMAARSVSCVLSQNTTGCSREMGAWLEQKAKAGTEWGLLMIGYDFKQLVRLMNA